MTASATTFLLMLRKNFVLQVRRPIGTLLEVIFPPLAISVLIILRFLQYEVRDHCFVTFDSDPLIITPPNNTYKIYYTPNNNQTNLIAELMRKRILRADIIGVDTEEEIVANLTDVAFDSPYEVTVNDGGVQFTQGAGCFVHGAGIVFDSLEGMEMEYTLRLRHEVGTRNTWRTREVADDVQSPGPRVSENFYLQEGFLHLESIVGKSIIEWKSGQELIDLQVSVRQLPYPEFRSNEFLVAAAGLLPFVLVLSLIYSAGIFTKELVLEKESRIRELLLITGLKQWVLWTSWYIKQLVFLLGLAIILSVMLKFGQLLPKSDFMLILTFMTLFMISAISFSFLISVLFSSAQVGLLAGFLFWFTIYLPYSYIFPPETYSLLNLGHKISICLLSNTCMGLGINTVTQREIRGEGAQWKDLFQPSSVDDDFTLGYSFVMLIFDSILYMVIAWYIDAVKPGKYGVPKPLYFPFLPSYWVGKPRVYNDKPKSNDDNCSQGIEMQDHGSSGAHEEEPTDLEVGIRISGLTKVYNESIIKRVMSLYKKSQQRNGVKVAVDGLNLNMYKGQITALLGHNGAGKTTTMSILTGLYTPTSGTAVVNGYDIRTDMKQIRKSLGICPQHDVLYGRLTVEEHLKLFGRIKGVSRKDLKGEVDELLGDLKLLDKRNTPSSQLSGGQKRKLGVGIALIGGSKFVVLDEPTSGMDPYARRATWDVLIKHKQERTIVLTTHFMDEADVLGDRIAIMAAGNLRCSGSSLFLKSKYGIGYHMVIEKAPSCNSIEVVNIVKSLVPGGKCVVDAGAELSLILPSQQTAKFPPLFEKLESRKSELGIAGFGVSVTTMEEVFLRVKEGTDETLEKRIGRTGSLSSHPNRNATSIASQGVSNGSRNHRATPLDTSVSNGSGSHHTTPLVTSASNGSGSHHATPPPVASPYSGAGLWILQFFAMLMKRFYVAVRFWQATLPQCLIPILSVLVALVIVMFLPNKRGNDPKRALTLSNSAIDPSNRFLFWADVGENSTNLFNFRSISARDLGATSFSDYSESVTNIIKNDVHIGTDLLQCCNYTHQILDKYCASVSLGNFSTVGSCGETQFASTFGYRRCSQCLECCETREDRPPSCTIPTTQFNMANRNSLCPSPPALSVVEFTDDVTTTGRLDSDNTYVNEYLLRLAENMGGPVYSRRVLGGFTLGQIEPTFSICGCDSFNFNLTEAFRNVTNLQQCKIDSSGTVSTTDLDINCANDDFSGSGNGNGPVFNGRMNGIDAASLQRSVCSECNQSSSEQPIGSFYRTQLIPTLTATVWYNNNPRHMPAAMLNVFHNVWLQNATGDSELSLRVNNHPLPRTAEGLANPSVGLNGYIIAVTVVGGYSFLLASFVIFIVAERESKVKHLEFVSGLYVTTYWISNVVWDFLNALVPVLISTAIFYALPLNAYRGDGLIAVFLLLLFTCLSGIPAIYLLSYLFKDSLTAFGVIIIILFLVTTQILRVIVLLVRDRAVKDILHFIFLFFPTYGLAAGLNDLYINDLLRRGCTSSPQAMSVCDRNENIFFVENVFAFSRPGIGITLIYMGVEAILFFAVTLLVERSFFLPEIRRLLRRRPTEITLVDESGAVRWLEYGSLPNATSDKDSDVRAEREKVMRDDISEDDIVVIKNIRKVYPSSLDGLTIRPPKVAVEGMNLIIPKGECFGLLGVNGAGKTTAFRMLTGDLSVSSGTARIAGFDIVTDLRKVQQRIGYCPQFDALLEKLTGRELLTIFARLRGIRNRLIKQTVDTEIKRLDLAIHGDKRCGSYSGGNKRKLSTAIALVGNPSVVFLDEPTTGMDPATRHYLWDVLTRIVHEGRSIVLTSHSMEECEALCTRLAIMVKGQFKCLGSVQHLKNKFGSGFSLQAKVKLPPPPEEPEAPQREKVSFIRRITRRVRRSHYTVLPRRTDEQGISENSTDSQQNGSRQRSATEDMYEGYDRVTSSHNSFRPKVSANFTRVRSLLLRRRSESLSKEDVPFDPYDTTALHTFINQCFPGADLLEEHQGSVTYQLPSEGVTWSSVFHRLELNKQRLGIVDYSISQTTLEQVFLGFARKQDEK